MFTRIIGLFALAFVVAACSSAPPAAVTSVTIDQGALSLDVGLITNLSATVVAVGGASQVVTWSIAPSGIATVDPGTGQVTTVAPGAAVITATSAFDAGKSDTVDLTVTGAPAVTSVTVDQDAFSLDVGDSTALTATVDAVGAASQIVTWSIAPSGIATVDPGTGLVTAVAPGAAVITATSAFDAGMSDSVDLTVNP